MTTMGEMPSFFGSNAKNGKDNVIGTPTQQLGNNALNRGMASGRSNSNSSRTPLRDGIENSHLENTWSNQTNNWKDPQGEFGLRRRNGDNRSAESGNSQTTWATSTTNTSYASTLQKSSETGTQIQDKRMDLPPAVSLMDMAASATFVAGNNISSLDSNVHRLPSTQNTTFRGGVDLGVSRGFDALNSRNYGTTQQQQSTIEHGAQGVTASMEVVAVNSPRVTVFGFPAGGGAAVLRHFQKFGEVRDHRSEPGNWMHILYASKVQASRALAQNGNFVRVGQERVMIGVKPCPETDFAQIGSVRQTQRQPVTGSEKYRIDQPEEVQHGPRRVMSICQRLCAWVMDW